jgi:hypothetical protein
MPRQRSMVTARHELVLETKTNQNESMRLSPLQLVHVESGDAHGDVVHVRACWGRSCSFACANLANLAAGSRRGTDSRTPAFVRALGAKRSRLLRQSMTECASRHVSAVH